MKQTPFPLVFVALASIWCLGGGVGFAQIGYTPSSIEWMTASSEVVALATIEDLTYKDHPPKRGETRSEWQSVTVTLKQEANLKGKAPEPLVFVVEQPRGAKRLASAKESAQPVLWFLVNAGTANDYPPRHIQAQLIGDLRLDGYLELGTAKTPTLLPHPVFSMDFKILKEKDEVLNAVKAAIAAGDKGPARRLWLPMPSEVARRAGRSGDINELRVPINSRLESLGGIWAGSKEEWLREAGVLALAQFKSEANAEIFKRLLDDKAWSIEARGDHEERVYYIREAAYMTLQEWGVRVAKPLLREPQSPK